MNESFFELIQVSIGSREGLSKTPTKKEWVKLYQMAEKQSLIGICFAGIRKLGGDADEGFANIGMPEMLYLTWMGTAASIQMRNEQLNRQCVELQERLAADGFRSCILKGQGVGSLYGDELSVLRQSGDIDAWVDTDALSIIEYVNNHVSCDEFDEKHIHYHYYSDTEVELHWIPVKGENPYRNKILRKYFKAESERQFANNNGKTCFPTSDFQLVHQLLHVFRHFVYEGIGMRQVMDLYFAQLECAKMEGGYEKVVALFKTLGLIRFVAATQWVLTEVFLMPTDKCLCEPNEKEGKKILEEILIGGNFGHHDERNHVKNETFMQRFFRRWGRKFRMFRFDPLGTILMPFSRIKLEIWMRKVRSQYGV